MIALSFHNGNVSPRLIEAQASVFKYFGLDILQVQTDMSHGAAIDWFLNALPWEEVAIFDIDCIPLHKQVLNDARKIVREGAVYGIAQSANHLSGKLYVGAPFICLSRKTMIEIGWPSFMETKSEDVAGEITRAAERAGKEVRMLWPTHVEVEKWKLADKGVFGLGTTYQDTVYHAFESRFNHESTSRFINKCNLITSLHDN